MLADRMRMGRADFYPYKIDQSCRFNDNDSAYLNATQGAFPTDNKKFTYSTWIKRCNLIAGNMPLIESYVSGVNLMFLTIDSYGRIYYYKYQSPTDWGKVWTPQLRDVSSWYHILFVHDSTEAIGVDRTKLFINETQIIDVNADLGDIVLNASSLLNGNGRNIRIGRNTFNGVYIDAYLAETHLIDGQALTPTSFGEFKNGIWIPKEYSGTYGTNGFYLDYADSSDFGKDVSGNGNDFTDSGLATDDQVLDSPTNNYPVLSPINKFASIALSNGNLNAERGAAAWATCLATMGLPNTGKWYFECKLGSDLSYLGIGVRSMQDGFIPLTSASNIGADAYGWLLYSNGVVGNYQKYHDGTNTGLTGETPSTGDVMQIAIDMDAGKIWFGVNNTWLDSGDPANGTDEIYSGLTGDLVPGISVHTYINAASYVNFGQLGFAHTPPTGFIALCSKNLPEPTILEGNKGMDVVLYEGTGAEQDITDFEFEPDLAWIKNRDATDEHKLIDSVRGVTKELSCDKTAIEAVDANGLTAFLSNGFTLGTGANGYNDNAESFVAWCFRMGTAYGFDIVSYEGTGAAHAINHDLGGTPELMIVKNLESLYNWIVYHYHALNKTDPETDYGLFDLSNAWADANTVWNDTAPTSTQFTVGTNSALNENGINHIAYLWRSISGFSKVFSYLGNGNADGSFVYCGFRPRYILIKKANTAVNSWFLYDTERSTYNPVTKNLLADTNVVEATDVCYLDILSNGFKLRSTVARFNTSGALYVGIAYAEQPGKYSNAR